MENKICHCKYETETHVCLCISKLDPISGECKLCAAGNHKLIKKEEIRPKIKKPILHPEKFEVNKL